MSVSVLILALDEEQNIGDCIRSVQWADEIVVVDSGSKDRTVSIARELGATVLIIPWEGYGATKNRALEHLSGSWVLWLDADERVTENLQREIAGIVSQDGSGLDSYDLARRAYFLGRWIRHAGWYQSRVARLFRRGSIRFSDKSVHEQLILDKTPGRLTHDLLHYTDPSLNHYFRKFNRYTTLAAEDLFSRGRRFRIVDLLVRPFFTFFRMYFFRAGFLDGLEGFILCVVSSAYVFVKYAKLWEIENTQVDKG